MKDKLKEIILMIIIFSFIGFCFEDLWMLVRYHLIDNRNMTLPFLLGYGVFMVAFYYIIGTPKKIFNKYEIKKPYNYLLYMTICFVIVSIGETILGLSLERIGHFHYWNYTKIPLHLNRYTSVPTSIGFSIVITIFMSFIYEPISNKIKKISKHIPLLLLVLILVVLIVDLNHSFKKMSDTKKGKNTIWVIHFKK